MSRYKKSPMITVQCSHCGTPKEIAEHTKSNKNFCNRECKTAEATNLVSVPCLAECGAKITVTARQSALVNCCNEACMAVYKASPILIKSRAGQAKANRDQNVIYLKYVNYKYVNTPDNSPKGKLIKTFLPVRKYRARPACNGRPVYPNTTLNTLLTKAWIPRL